MKLKLIRIKHIRNRIAIYYSLLIILIIIAISFTIITIFSKQYIDLTNNIVEQKMSIITRDIDRRLNDVKTLFTYIRNDQNVQNLMAMRTYTDDDEKSKALNISNILSSKYLYGNSLVSNIIAVSADNHVLNPLYSIKQYRDMIIDNKNYKNFVNGDYFSRFSTPITFPTDQEENMTITYYAEYLSNKDYSKLGYILINLKKEDLFSDIKPFCTDTFDATFIVDKSGQLIYSIGDIPYNHNIAKIDKRDTTVIGNSVNSININNKNYLAYSKELNGYPDWFAIGLVSKQRLTEKLWLMNMIIYGIGILCIIMVAIIGFLISKKITDPILDIENAMKKLEDGVWPEKVKANTNDELKHLATGFNRMVESIKSLINDIYKEQEEKKKAEVMALQYQLDSLQSQINPHFMYNTLNSIEYLALKDGANDIREMIQSFNILLRASMSVGRQSITIEEEISLVKSYLKIQECRYDKIADFTYDLPEELKYKKIPKLILQPLVENSLFHGIAPKDSHGTIIVRFKCVDDKISVAVIDDGVGMSEDEIQNIMKNVPLENKRSFNKIGLVNVDERLKLYYGDEFRLKIFSKIGIGTCISFYIPNIE